MKSRRAGVSLSLNFLLGLIFTGILIVFTLGVVAKFNSVNHHERDLVASWVKDIKSLKDKEFTQLLIINEEDVANNYVYSFTSKGAVEFTIESKRADLDSKYIFPFDGIIKVKPKCTKFACICIIDVRENKGRVSYCEEISNFEKVTYAVKGYSYTIQLDMGSTKEVVVQGPENGELPFFVSKYHIVKYPETRNVLYARVNGKELKLCDDRKLCEN